MSKLELVKELPENFKGINSHNLYLYVKSYMAKLRANTARVKNRSEVSGGGKKPKAQKGSGGARWGSKRSPLFVGGGQVFGPTKRNYNLKVNTKQKVLALNYALNAQAKKGALLVADSMSVPSGKTKDAKKISPKAKTLRALSTASLKTESSMSLVIFPIIRRASS